MSIQSQLNLLSVLDVLPDGGDTDEPADMVSTAVVAETTAVIEPVVYKKSAGTTESWADSSSDSDN